MHPNSKSLSVCHSPGKEKFERLQVWKKSLDNRNRLWYLDSKNVQFENIVSVNDYDGFEISLNS